MTKLFVAINLEKFDIITKKELINKMPPNRIEKFAKLPKQKKFECLAGFLFAVFCIKHNFKTKKTLEFSRKNNKPFVVDHKNICFNISHTKNALACAISTSKIGVDIEKIRPINFNIAKRICCNQEFKIFETLMGGKTDFLLKIWTGKESFAKMNAESVFSNIRKVNVLKIKNLKTFKLNEYILSVCGSCSVIRAKPVFVNFKNVIEYVLKYY